MRTLDQQFDPDSHLKDVTIVNISHVVVLHELDYYFLQESWLANYSKSPVALPPERTIGMAVSTRKIAVSYLARTCRIRIFGACQRVCAARYRIAYYSLQSMRRAAAKSPPKLT